jgi:hypothetical protein
MIKKIGHNKSNKLLSIPSKIDDIKAEVHNPLIEVNLETKDEPRLIYASENLLDDYRKSLVSLLYTYKDYFAWDYDELSMLDKSFVAHPFLTVKARKYCSVIIVLHI